MIFSVLIRKLAIVWHAEKIWRKPKAAKVLIYDRCGSEILLGYIRKEDVEILDVRGESVNIYVLLRCILSFDLFGASYVNKYISIVNPSVILTFIDNNPRFHELKRANPQATTIFLQNGWRGETADIFGRFMESPPHKNYHADYMLTFGSAIGLKYLEYINGQVIPIGSIKCNICPIEQSTETRSLVFISQFSAPPGNSGQANFVRVGNQAVTWEAFYSAERKVLQCLAKHCENRQLALQVCGRSPDSSGEEYEFFREAVGNREWQFIPRDDVYGNYAIIDRAAFVVGIDSTLVYESLARGKKTGVFSIRSDLLSDPAAKFGWPEKLPDSGPFWTNHADESEFERVLDYLTSVSDADWEQTRTKYVPNLIEYDPGNTRFTSLLQTFDVQLNDRCIFHVQR